MKKHLLSLIILLQAAISAAAQTDAAAADSVYLGNCEGRGVSMSGSDITGAALFFPQSNMRLLAGNSLEKVYLYVNYPRQAEDVQVFVTQSLDKPYDRVFPAQVSRTGWNEIVLDEPYELSGDSLYLGFTLKSCPVSYAPRRFDGPEFSLQNGKWVPYENDAYSIAIYGVVRGDELPAHNAVWQCRTPFLYAVSGQPNEIEGTVFNKGVTTINSLTFTYRYDGQTETETVEGLNIPYLGQSGIRLQGPAFAESGQYDLTVELTAVNGQPDLDDSDNASDTYHYTCLDEFVQRNALMEVFSTELCTNCPAAHAGIDYVVDGNHRIVEVGHHSGYYTDPFTVDASVDYEWFYGTMKFAPAYMMDRTNRYDRYPGMYTYGHGGPIGGVGYLEEVIADALATPAFATVQLEVTSEGGDNYRQLTIHVTGESLLPLPEGHDDRLFVYLTEDSIFTENQAGAAGNYYHRHSLRQSLSDTWGDPVALDEGFEKTYTVEVPREWNMKQMEVVAFVGNYNAADYNDCQVYNATSQELHSFVPTGISTTEQTTPVERHAGRCAGALGTGRHTHRLACRPARRCLPLPGRRTRRSGDRQNHPVAPPAGIPLPPSGRRIATTEAKDCPETGKGVPPRALGQASEPAFQRAGRMPRQKQPQRF